MTDVRRNHREFMTDSNRTKDSCIRFWNCRLDRQFPFTRKSICLIVPRLSQLCESNSTKWSNEMTHLTVLFQQDLIIFT